MKRLVIWVSAAILLAAATAYAQIAVSSGGPQALIVCDQTAVVTIAGAATTDSIPLVAGKKVFVCGYALSVQGAAAPNSVQFKTGTGAACGTGTANLTGAMLGQSTAGAVIRMESAVGFRGAASGSVCITTTTADAVGGHISFAQF